MSSVILTNKAIADLKDIGRYTQEHWGREQRKQKSRSPRHSIDGNGPI